MGGFEGDDVEEENEEERKHVCVLGMLDRRQRDAKREDRKERESAENHFMLDVKLTSSLGRKEDIAA